MKMVEVIKMMAVVVVEVEVDDVVPFLLQLLPSEVVVEVEVGEAILFPLLPL